MSKIKTNEKELTDVSGGTKYPNIIVYIVQRGDNFSKIAEKFNTDTATIMNINNIHGSHLLRPGMKLLVPDNN